MKISTVRFLFIFALSLSVLASSDIPVDNLTYPVLLTFNSGGSATGFYFRDNMFYYLVTAKHVLLDKRTDGLKSGIVTLLSYSKELNPSYRIKRTIDLTQLNARGLVRLHPTQDVAVIRLGEVASIKADGSTIAYPDTIVCVEGEELSTTSSNTETLRLFDNVLISNEAFIFGFPTSIGIKEVPQIDRELPLLRRGIIAGKNPTNRTIILDCPVYPGNSGGPVIQLEQDGLLKKRYRMIGVISQFVPFKEIWHNKTYNVSHREFSNSGYSVITPMDAVLELLWKSENDKGQPDPGR